MEFLPTNGALAGKNGYVHVVAGSAGMTGACG